MFKSRYQIELDKIIACNNKTNAIIDDAQQQLTIIMRALNAGNQSFEVLSNLFKQAMQLIHNTRRNSPDLYCLNTRFARLFEGFSKKHQANIIRINLDSREKCAQLISDMSNAYVKLKDTFGEAKVEKEILPIMQRMLLGKDTQSDVSCLDLSL